MRLVSFDIKDAVLQFHEEPTTYVEAEVVFKFADDGSGTENSAVVRVRTEACVSDTIAEIRERAFSSARDMLYLASHISDECSLSELLAVRAS